MFPAMTASLGGTSLMIQAGFMSGAELQAACPTFWDRHWNGHEHSWEEGRTPTNFQTDMRAGPRPSADSFFWNLPKRPILTKNRRLDLDSTFFSPYCFHACFSNSTFQLKIGIGIPGGRKRQCMLTGSLLTCETDLVSVSPLSQAY